MAQVIEYQEIEPLGQLRQEWGSLLRSTPGASFFQSLEWLEIYWKHFGAGQKLRVFVVFEEGRPQGILPLVIRRETTNVGQVRTLTFPLHDWGSFYGPIGPDPGATFLAGLEHLRRMPRDWDILELRWQGAPNTNPTVVPGAMAAAGFHCYATIWDHTAIVDLSGSWESYWSTRKTSWLQRFRQTEQKLNRQGEISYLRYRPLGIAQGDGLPRWDLYDACEEIARRSWQGAATDGTTLSHASVRQFLRDVHQAAAAYGAVDLNLLSLDGRPVAFLYNYAFQGYVSGLRRGYDAEQCRNGAGNILLARALQDSFARGDRIFDLGVGSLGSKRHYQTSLLPIWRFSYFPPMPLRVQLLRAKRWLQQRRFPASIAVGRVQDGTADAR
jgi:CelD/BcsL family acetyltransferase involved in cellulose biosynthesis